MTRYRPSVETHVMAGPMALENSSIFAFMFQGDAHSIQTKLVDPWLSPRGESDYELLFNGLFLVNFIRQNRVSSESDSEPARGYLNYREATIFVAVRCRNTGQRYWFTPTMHLDSFIALATGREVFGFPKAWGEIDMPDEPMDQPVSFSLWTETFAQPAAGTTTERLLAMRVASQLADDRHLGGNFGPALSGRVYDTYDAYVNLLKEHTEKEHMARPGAERDGEGLLSVFGDMVEEGWESLFGDIWEFVKLFIALLEPGIFLKQFPNDADLSAAVYQELLSIQFTPTSLPSGLRILYDYQGWFGNNYGYPLADSLGLPANQAVDAKFGLWLETSFKTETPRIIS